MTRLTTSALMLLAACGGDVVLQDRPPSTTSPTSTTSGTCAPLAIPGDACGAFAEDAKSAAALRSMLRAREVIVAARIRIRDHCDRITDALAAPRAVANDDKVASAACTRAREALVARTSQRISEVHDTVPTVECTPEPPGACAGVVPAKAAALDVGCPDYPLTLDTPSDLAAEGALLQRELPPIQTAFLEVMTATRLYEDVAGDLAQVGAVDSPLPAAKMGCLVADVSELNDVVTSTAEDAIQADQAIRDALTK